LVSQLNHNRYEHHKNPPVIYIFNEKVWATQELFTDWFHNHFVPEQGLFSGKRGARTHKRGRDKYTESFLTI
jgi:hypothetical protein